MTKPTARELLDEAKDSDWSVTRDITARVEAVLALHCRRDTIPPTCCGCGYAWPCPTVRLLNGEEL